VKGRYCAAAWFTVIIRAYFYFYPQAQGCPGKGLK
jgi:hypothetical protein